MMAKMDDDHAMDKIRTPRSDGWDMKADERRLLGMSAAFALAVNALASTVSATYLGVINIFICTLVRSFIIIGNSIAVVMFIYGGIRYMYTSDDPGGRKQAMGICIAAVIAMIIIQAGSGVIGQIGDIIAADVAGVTNPTFFGCP